MTTLFKGLAEISLKEHSFEKLWNPGKDVSCEIPITKTSLRRRQVEVYQRNVINIHGPSIKRRKMKEITRIFIRLYAVIWYAPVS